MENEIWKTIEGCEDYQISNLGKVKNIKTNKFLNSYLDNQGYEKISLCVNNKTKNFKKHRLIAIYFIPNPENKLTVNHINKIKNDNRIENLEWATMSEQNLAVNKSKDAFLNKSDRRSILRIQLSDKTTILEHYNSIIEASKWLFNNNKTTFNEFNKLTSSIISSKLCAVANNKRNMAYDYKWIYNNGDEIVEGEIWKEIPLELTDNIPNYYVSSLGRFKNKNGNIVNVKSSSGYKRIMISKKSYLLHRLVAIIFILNPENKEQVNHIDGNKLNNTIENLEWVTNQENQIHKFKIGFKGTKKIIQYDGNMSIINKFNSIIEAAKILGISATCISNNCSGKTSITKCGFNFRYDNT